MGALTLIVLVVLPINVSDGPCLPWISVDLNSKLPEKTTVSMKSSKSSDDSNGHLAEISVDNYVRYREEYCKARGACLSICWLKFCVSKIGAANNELRIFKKRFC